MQPGDTLGKYTIESLIAMGGMAEVWLATASGVGGFKKQVVLKTILPQLAENPDFVHMFVNEALLAAKLNHPNIVQIFDLGQADGRYFIAMELVLGRTLRQISRIRRRQNKLLPPWFVLHVVKGVADGLSYAHEFSDEKGQRLGLVHRDVTPENVMITFTGAVKLLDFGVAKATQTPSLTRAGTIKGKYAYLSPEQARGLPADQRCDTYAAGIILYELLTGVRPFWADNEIMLLRKVAVGNPPRPREVSKWLPQELDDIIVKALAFRPEDRHSEVGQLEEEISAFLKARQDRRGRRDLGQFVSKLFAGEADIPADVLKRLRRQAGDAPLPEPRPLDKPPTVESLVGGPPGLSTGRVTSVASPAQVSGVLGEPDRTTTMRERDEEDEPRTASSEIVPAGSQEETSIADGGALEEQISLASFTDLGVEMEDEGEGDDLSETSAVPPPAGVPFPGEDKDEPTTPSGVSFSDAMDEDEDTPVSGARTAEVDFDSIADEPEPEPVLENVQPAADFQAGRRTEPEGGPSQPEPEPEVETGEEEVPLDPISSLWDTASVRLSTGARDAMANLWDSASGQASEDVPEQTGAGQASSPDAAETDIPSAPGFTTRAGRVEDDQPSPTSPPPTGEDGEQDTDSPNIFRAHRRRLARDTDEDIFSSHHRSTLSGPVRSVKTQPFATRERSTPKPPAPEPSRRQDTEDPFRHEPEPEEQGPKQQAAEHFEAGLAHMRDGEREEARQEWEKAAALDPDKRLYKINLRQLDKQDSPDLPASARSWWGDDKQDGDA